MRRILVVFSFLSCLLYACCQATASLDSLSVALPEVVITGTGTEHYLKDAPVQTEVISGKTLQSFSGRSIEEILGAISPSFSFSQTDMGSGMQLNGLSNGYILIMIDGRKINGDMGGQNDLNTINIANIERIEIVKGASSALYGSDAIAGVVNFITKKNNDLINFTNTSRIGWYADFLQNNTISFKIKSINSTTSINFKHTDGWQNTTQEWYRHKLYNNSVTRSVNSSNNYKVSQSLIYNITDNLSLKCDASFYQRWVQRPSGFPQWQLKNFHYRDQNYSLEATYILPHKNRLSIDAMYNSYTYFYDYTQREYTDMFDKNGTRIVFYPGDRVMQSIQSRFMVKTTGLFHIGNKQIVNSGIEYSLDMLISPMRLVGGDKASAYTLAAYIQDEINIIPNLNFTLGLRFVHHKAFGQIVTPKISAMYKLWNFRIRATYSYGFKAPTVKELYYSYIATIMTNMKAYYGNDKLRPQVSNYWAVGLEYNIANVKTNITLYHNAIRNMIALQPVPTSPEDKKLEVEETMRYSNLAKARSFGGDFNIDVTLPKGFSFGGGYSYTDAKAQDPEQTNFLEYMYINGTSLHNASLRIAWEHYWEKYKLGINIFARYQSKRFYVTDGDTKPYHIWRINTSHSILRLKKWSVDINIGIDNIFNYIDKTPFGKNRATSTPGRTAYMSVIVKFQNRQGEKIKREYTPRNEIQEDDNETL